MENTDEIDEDKRELNYAQHDSQTLEQEMPPFIKIIDAFEERTRIMTSMTCSEFEISLARTELKEFCRNLHSQVGQTRL